MSDLSSVILWWLAILLVGSTTIPITTRLFSRFVDRGYIFSKVVGILLSSFLVWFLGSIHVLPFTRLSQIVVLVFIAIVNFMIFWRDDTVKTLPWRWIIFEEMMFLLTLAAWSYVRATEPSIRGLEKFMDFGFVNSILRTTFFPPKDMWLTQSPDYTGGHFINYYYFGHYITAFLTKLTGIDSVITYNLAIATLFAFTFTLSFSLGTNLLYLFQLSQKLISNSKKLVVSGFLAAFLVSLGGNLHPLYVLTSGYPNEEPVAPWNLSLGLNPDRYWYPNATRFIPFTIHEFPIYSFVVADLHGHVSDIPFVLLVLAILLAFVTNKHTHDSREIFSHLGEFMRRTGLPFFSLLLLGVLLASMYMTNAWDGLIYLVLTGCVMLYINFRQSDKGLQEGIVKTFSASLFLLFFFLVASLPFSLSFKPFASGVGVLCAPSFLVEKKLGPLVFEKDKCQKSPIWMVAILWGFFYYNVIGYLAFVIIPSFKAKWEVRGGKLDHEVGSVIKRISHVPTQFLTSHLSPLTSNFLALSPVDVYVLIIIFVSTLLLIFPEFFYIRDIYPAHYRANTMFKLGYQAFMMLALCAAYTFMRLRDRKTLSLPRIFYNSLYIFLFALVAIFPYFAINSYYGSLKTYHGLWGLNWLSTQYPQDYEAILWIRTHIEGQPVIAEAQGDSYTDYARVSANTGLPTIVGWPVHEWLWRGSYDEAGKRIPEVATVYESSDLQAVRDVLKKYNVSYIFVGALEKEKYPTMNVEKFNRLGRVVFESGETKIYKITI